jgi:hypothetical protein
MPTQKNGGTNPAATEFVSTNDPQKVAFTSDANILSIMENSPIVSMPRSSMSAPGALSPDSIAQRPPRLEGEQRRLSSVPMPKVFHPQLAILKPHILYSGGMDGSVLRPGEIAEQVLPKVSGATLFAYCFRRFGYPNVGWDESKNLANYLLTTPEPGLFLEIVPYLGSTSSQLMFGYSIAKDLEEQTFYKIFLGPHGGHKAWEQSVPRARFDAALRRSMEDLTRPVFIRDVPINCYGRCGVGHNPMPRRKKAAPFVAAGYPIDPLLLIDTDRYERFDAALALLGSGDRGAGMEMVIAYANEASKK